MECRVKTDPGLILMRDFSYFQYHFIAVYSLAYEILSEKNITSIEELITLSVEDLISFLPKNKNISHYARSTNIPKKFDLYLVHINCENPIMQIFKGVAVAIVLAVIFSGGKIEISSNGIKAELPPLGDGIRSIKEAFKGDLQNIDLKKQIKQDSK